MWYNYSQIRGIILKAIFPQDKFPKAFIVLIDPSQIYWPWEYFEGPRMSNFFEGLHDVLYWFLTWKYPSGNWKAIGGIMMTWGKKRCLCSMTSVWKKMIMNCMIYWKQHFLLLSAIQSAEDFKKEMLLFKLYRLFHTREIVQVFEDEKFYLEFKSFAKTCESRI